MLLELPTDPAERRKAVLAALAECRKEITGEEDTTEETKLDDEHIDMFEFWVEVDLMFDQVFRKGTFGVQEEDFTKCKTVKDLINLLEPLLA